ncbi:MAG: ABC transporter substrate-binding protein [Chloroflexota bacterium]|nr:ABC transporter substrate-binding protein [Chloroflexota bacterium]
MASQRQGRPALRQEDVEQAESTDSAVQEQPQAGQTRGGDETREGSSPAAPAPEALVNPLEWRELYHWRELAALHDPPRTRTIGGSLTLESDAIDSWDPFAAWDPEIEAAQSGHLLPLVYSRLVELDVSDSSDAHRTLIQGDLAPGWEWPDPTTLVFPLRPGVYWPEGSPTEGRPLDAVDVATSHAALMEPGRRQAPIYEAVERIEAYAGDEDRGVVFHLRHSSAPLLNQMTSPWQVVLPAEIASGTQRIDLSQRSVGSGPFTLRRSDGRSSWVLTRNPTYGRADAEGLLLPYLDEVRGEGYPFRDQVAGTAPGSARWAAWESGAAQAIALDGPADAERALSYHPDSQLQVTPPSPSGGSHFSFRSLTDGPFADVRVRAALSMALHRGNLAALAYDGFAAPDAAQNWTFFPATGDSSGGLREWPWEEDELGGARQYDPNQALALLSAAGYSEEQPLALGVDMPPSVNPAGQPYDPGAHRIAELVAQQWEQYLFGAVEVRRLERVWAQFTDSQGSLWFIPEPDPAVDLVFQDPADVDVYDADADDLAYGSVHSAGRFNRAGINDPEIDEWATAQRRALDPLERADLLERIRLKEQDEVWRLLLINPYGVRVRRAHVFNLVDTYYAKSLQLAPDQLKHVRVES